MKNGSFSAVIAVLVASIGIASQVRSPSIGSNVILAATPRFCYGSRAKRRGLSGQARRRGIVARRKRSRLR